LLYLEPGKTIMSGQIAAWHAEHLNFARLLRLFEGQVTLFAEGETPDYGLMQDIVYYLRHFPDVHHHRYEDVAFAYLRQRDPNLRSLVSRLTQEHRVIGACGEKLLALLGRVVDGAVIARVEVEALAATFLTYYRAHLDAEESVMLPRAVALLGADDWVAIAAKVQANSRDDPLFGTEAEERFRALRLAIESEAAAVRAVA
jgi:hemerythrin-like domain-containing protein